MKCYLILTCLALLATPVLAQIDPGDNGIGIYADQDGLTNNVKLEVGVAMEVYLLLTRPTGETQLAGWECSLVQPDNVSVWGFNYPNPGTIAIIDGDNFCGVHSPMVPYADVNLLMTFIIVPLDGQCARFFIEEFTGQSGVTEPRYLDGSDLIDMKPYPDGNDLATFTVNEEGLSTESASLDQVKALYR